MPSAVRPKAASTSAALPERPNTSSTPWRTTGTGQAPERYSATAEPRPPTMLCSSVVTMAPVSRAAWSTSSPSRGLMVCISMTRTLTPSPERASAAFMASWTMSPTAITVTSLPCRRVTPLPSWKE